MDDDPGIDDIEAMEDIMLLSVHRPEAVEAQSDPNREPPRRARRARGAVGARAPAEPASVVATGGDDEDSLIQRGVCGKRAPKTLSEPYVPTQAEIEEHNKSHPPWRSWCTACVGGGAVAHPHHAAPGHPENSRLPDVLMDYVFMGQEENKVLPMIWIKERQSKMKFAHHFEEKGPSEYTILSLIHI